MPGFECCENWPGPKRMLNDGNRQFDGFAVFDIHVLLAGLRQ